MLPQSPPLGSPPRPLPDPDAYDPRHPEQVLVALERLQAHVERTILCRQHPVTGLFPASTAVTVHGNYTHAWVRDNVYSLIAPWALALAWRRSGLSPNRAGLLERRVAKTMRGLLQAMLRQAAKVERFKRTQDPADALHAIYGADTGLPVAADDGWGHLQLDATALYLLMLAQMTRAGLAIVASPAEAAFVQNLVHYIGPAYRTADYGIWERGRKTNDGAVELNASSVGMAKAALEAIQGLDLFGPDALAPGSLHQGVIHVVPDEVARARATLEALLPRESGSKEVDAALLSAIGFPAFAVEDPELVADTRAGVLGKLAGAHGCKRFLRDGHQTAVEDHGRLHYETGELERFAGIEAEWPLFFTYLYLTAAMQGDRREAVAWRRRIAPLLVWRDGEPLLPELYTVPADLADAERAAPGSQPREPNPNVPLLWAQSLYLAGLMLELGVVAPEDLDPCGRRLAVGLRPPVPLRLVVLAADEGVRAALRREGVEAQTLEAATGGPDGPVRICAADALSDLLGRVGACPALGLTGRPRRRLGTLIAAQVFRVSGRLCVFLPGFDDPENVYFGRDNALLAERLTTEIAYVNRSWHWPEPPLLVLPVTAGTVAADGFDALCRTLADLMANRVDGLAVEAGLLSRCAIGARQVVLDGLPPPEPLRLLPVPAADTATRPEGWAAIRAAAAVAGLYDERLQDAVKELVVRRKRLLLGPGTEASALVTGPADNAAVLALLRRFGPGEGVFGAALGMLAAELVLFAGMLVKASPLLFRHCLSVRPLELLDLLRRDRARQDGIDLEAATARLLADSPHRVLTRLRRLAAGCPGMTGDFCLPVLSGTVAGRPLFALDSETGPWAALSQSVHGNWSAWRDVSGAFLPLPEEFFGRVWEVLRHCDALVLADPADPAHRLDSAPLRADMTRGERDFAQTIEQRLDRIADPSYRQLTVEALWAVSELLKAQPALAVPGTLAMDHLLAAAVRRHREEAFADRDDIDDAGTFLAAFALPPVRLAELVAAEILAATDQGTS